MKYIGCISFFAVLFFSFGFSKSFKKDKILKIKLEYNSMKPSAVVKKGESHETIECYYDSVDSKYKITVTQNKKSYTKKTAEINVNEWNALQKVIKNNGILQWQKNEFHNDTMLDGSNLRLTFTLPNDISKKYSWLNSNPANAGDIMKYMIELVKKNIPGIGYVYLLNAVS